LCDDGRVWKLFNLKILSAAISIKSLLLAAFSDKGHNEGLQNGFEDLLISFHGHEMATDLATTTDKSSCRKSRKV
jgi:hypothetical protein